VPRSCFFAQLQTHVPPEVPNESVGINLSTTPAFLCISHGDARFAPPKPDSALASYG
jgi:hypothetical protein